MTVNLAQCFPMVWSDIVKSSSKSTDVTPSAGFVQIPNTVFNVMEISFWAVTFVSKTAMDCFSFINQMETTLTSKVSIVYKNVTVGIIAHCIRLKITRIFVWNVQSSAWRARVILNAYLANLLTYSFLLIFHVLIRARIHTIHR